MWSRACDNKKAKYENLILYSALIGNQCSDCKMGWTWSVFVLLLLFFVWFCLLLLLCVGRCFFVGVVVVVCGGGGRLWTSRVSAFWTFCNLSIRYWWQPEVVIAIVQPGNNPRVVNCTNSQSNLHPYAHVDVTSTPWCPVFSWILFCLMSS